MATTSRRWCRRFRRSQYEPPTLEANSGDVEWLSPRAVAHDRVLTWASDLGAGRSTADVLAVQRTARRARDAARPRASQLVSTLGRLAEGREYALRVYRVDSRAAGRRSSNLSPRLAELAGTAAAASPGQRYLLERKLDAEKRNEMRAVTQRLVDEIASRARRAHRYESVRVRHSARRR